MCCPAEAPAAAAKGVGRPPAHSRYNAGFAAYAERFGVSWRKVRNIGIGRLEACKDDATRRILLGASEIESTEEIICVDKR